MGPADVCLLRSKPQCIQWELLPGKVTGQRVAVRGIRRAKILLVAAFSRLRESWSGNQGRRVGDFHARPRPPPLAFSDFQSAGVLRLKKPAR